MNKLSATITLAVMATVLLGATILGPSSVEAKSKEILKESQQQSSNPNPASSELSKQSSSAQGTSVLDPFSTSGVSSFTSSSDKPFTASQISTLVPTQTSNPLLDKEEFDITVTNIKHDNITLAITVDGLHNSTEIQGNPINVINPTSKLVVFKFDRHENAKTPSVLPIKLGDQYTVCISFSSNKGETSCITASIDSITQPQKKTLDANYIPL